MIYFISDVHLGVMERSEDKLREDKLLSVLDKMALDAKKIYLVGDIFDFWFDYKQVIPKHFYRTLSKLHEIRNNVCEIEFIIGNHDFGHSDFFEKELNIPVFGTDIIRNHSGKKFYISHGDGKDINDKGYLLLKKVMRNPLSLKLYLMLHPNLGIKLASGSSKESRKYSSQKHYNESDVLFKFAQSKIEEGFDYVVMGHRHKASKEIYKTGIYLNIGEWIKKPTFAVFDGKDINHIFVADYLKQPTSQLNYG